jgi:hypothetical protein
MRDKAIVFAAGEGKLLSARGSAMFFKATHASTNGAFSFMERSSRREAESRRRIFIPIAKKRFMSLTVR